MNTSSYLNLKKTWNKTVISQSVISQSSRDDKQKLPLQNSNKFDTTDKKLTNTRQTQKYMSFVSKTKKTNMTVGDIVYHGNPIGDNYQYAKLAGKIESFVSVTRKRAVVKWENGQINKHNMSSLKTIMPSPTVVKTAVEAPRKRKRTKTLSTPKKRSRKSVSTPLNCANNEDVNVSMFDENNTLFRLSCRPLIRCNSLESEYIETGNVETGNVETDNIETDNVSMFDENNMLSNEFLDELVAASLVTQENSETDELNDQLVNSSTNYSCLRNQLSNPKNTLRFC